MKMVSPQGVGADVEARAVLAEPGGEDATAAAEKALKAATKAAAAARAARGEPDPLVTLALEAGVSAAPAATLRTVAFIPAARSFGTTTASAPQASAVLMQAPRLCGS